MISFPFFFSLKGPKGLKLHTRKGRSENQKELSSFRSGSTFLNGGIKAWPPAAGALNTFTHTPTKAVFVRRPIVSGRLCEEERRRKRKKKRKRI